MLPILLCFVLYFSYFVVDTPYSMKTKKSNNAGDGTYRCEACNFETKYSQNLQAHFKTLKHLGNTRMSCEESHTLLSLQIEPLKNKPSSVLPFSLFRDS